MGRQGDSQSQRMRRKINLSLSRCLPVSLSLLRVATIRHLPVKWTHSTRRSFRVFVAASLECFPDLSPQEGLEALADLEYSAVEIPIHESARGLKPSDVYADLERAARFCRDTHRLDIAALDIELAPGPDYYTHFTSCCKLAKAIKVVSLVIPCSELGTPFNE